MKEFRLTTVTYVTAPAPYLAIRVLLQLAEDEGGRYPQAAEVRRRNTYIDDIMAGADTKEEALSVRRQTVDLLRAAGFELSKWASTHAELCPDMQQAEKLFTEDTCVGALGVCWTPAEDSLRLKAVPTLSSMMERSILSDVARLFDPAGWAAPVTIVAKTFIQEL